MAGSFLACTPGVNVKAKFGGLKALFSGEGAFLLEASGNGDLFFNSFGGIVEKKIEGDFIVDSGHVVAFEPSLNYKIWTSFKSFISSNSVILFFVIELLIKESFNFLYFSLHIVLSSYNLFDNSVSLSISTVNTKTFSQRSLIIS